jgi:predicted site-specific integrase-resolvase
MKLSAWAKVNGLSYKTAWRLRKKGSLPLPAEQLSTGTIIIHDFPTPTNNAVVYARVYSSDQTAALDRQLQRLKDFAAVQGLRVMREVQEIGSGFN